MNKSESIVNLAAALVKAQAEFPEIPKTKEVIVNSQKGAYTFKYAPLEKMIAIVRPILAKYGLGFTQLLNGDALETILMHESGEWLGGSTPLPDPGHEQMYGSKLTFRRRYSLKAALGVETDEDDHDSQPQKVSGRITPTTDCMDRVDPKRHESIHRIAGSIIDCFNNAPPLPHEAYKAYLEVTVAEEKIAVWSFLDSKMRRQLKKMDEEARVKEKANAGV